MDDLGAPDDLGRATLSAPSPLAKEPGEAHRTTGAPVSVSAATVGTMTTDRLKELAMALADRLAKREPGND